MFNFAWLWKRARIMPKSNAFSFKILVLQFLWLANRPIALLKPLLFSSALWQEPCYKNVSAYLFGFFNSLIPGWVLSEEYGCNDPLAICWRHYVLDVDVLKTLNMC